MKKNILTIVLLLMGIMLIPQVHALSLQEVSVLNNSDSYQNGTPVVEGNGTSNVTITYNAADLKIVPANRDIGRPIDAAWVGVKVLAPKDMEIETLKKATFITNGSASQLFWNSQDTPNGDKEQKGKEHFINVFGAITEDHLKKATLENKMITYTWKFDWDDNKDIDQTVTIKINPTGVVLKEKESETHLWDFSKYEEVKQSAEPLPEIQDEVPQTGDEILLIAISFAMILASGYWITKFEE